MNTTQVTFIVNDGSFQPFHNPLVVAEADSWDDEVKINGLQMLFSYPPSEMGPEIELYEWTKAEEAQPRWLVTVCLDYSYTSHFFARTLSEAMATVNTFLPIARALSEGTILEEINRVATLSFRAYHGHESYGCCQRCSPAEYESLAIRRRQKLSQDGLK